MAKRSAASRSKIDELEVQLLESQREVARLQEENAMLQAREISPQDLGILGRVSITRGRDTDFPEFVKAVDKWPGIYEQFGLAAAYAYADHVKSLMHALAVRWGNTPDLIRAVHRLEMLYQEPDVWIMCGACGSAVASRRRRRRLIHLVEQYIYAPAIKAAFDRSTETPGGLLPTNPNA